MTKQLYVLSELPRWRPQITLTRAMARALEDEEDKMGGTTPRPCMVKAVGGESEWYWLVDAEGARLACSRSETALELLALAVNSHDALLDACEAVVEKQSTLPNSVYEQVRAAIALAEPKSNGPLVAEREVSDG